MYVVMCASYVLNILASTHLDMVEVGIQQLPLGKISVSPLMLGLLAVGPSS